MDIPSLQALLAVAECGSFSKAANRLYVTQPAVSKRISTLEDELGSHLFDRVGRRISLTEAGRALLPRARRIIEAVEDSKRAIANLSDRVEGQLHIGTSHHIGLHRLPPILRAYNNRFPQVELNIQFLDSEAACQAVELGELELGIVTLPVAPPTVLSTEPIWPDPLAVVTGPDHPLSRRAALRPADLAPYPAVMPSPGTYTRELVEAAFAPLGLHPPVSLSSNYLETIKMLVSVGLGWGVLPLSMVDADVVAHPVTGLNLSRSLGVVQHTARTLSNAAAAMLELLHQSRNENRGNT